MRIITALTASLFLVACGSQNVPLSKIPISEINLDHVLIESEIRVSVENFLGYCKYFPEATETCLNNLKNLKSVTYTDSFLSNDNKENVNIVGRCTIKSNGERDIQILKNYASPTSLSYAALVNHELGHCLLNRGHAPKGSLRIMAPQMLRESEYGANWSAMLDDLFKNFIPWGGQGYSVVHEFLDTRADIESR